MSLPDTAEYWWDVKAARWDRACRADIIPDRLLGQFTVWEAGKKVKGPCSFDKAKKKFSELWAADRRCHIEEVVSNGVGHKGKVENTMKNMSKAREFIPAPPPAVYKSRITSAEAESSAAGNAMIRVSGELLEPEQHVGTPWFDNILTDGEAKGAGFGKKKLRELGFDVDTEGYEIADEEIAQKITGIELYIDFGNKQRMAKDPATDKYTVPVFDTVNGKQVPVMQLEVKHYLGAMNTAPAVAPTAPAEAPATAPVAAQPTPAAQPAPAAAKAATPPWAKNKAATQPASAK